MLGYQWKIHNSAQYLYIAKRMTSFYAYIEGERRNIGSEVAIHEKIKIQNRKKG